MNADPMSLYPVRASLLLYVTHTLLSSTTWIGFDIPGWSHFLFLYSRLKPGRTVFEWDEEHNVRKQGIDVRRFMSFGVIKVSLL